MVFPFQKRWNVNEMTNLSPGVLRQPKPTKMLKKLAKSPWKRRVAAKFMSRPLTSEKKLRIMQCFERKIPKWSKLVFKVITSDEWWYYGYDPETKQQSGQWKTPSSRQKKNLSSEIKGQNNTNLLIRCERSRPFQVCSTVSVAVNQAFYLEALKRLCNII